MLPIRVFDCREWEWEIEAGLGPLFSEGDIPSRILPPGSNACYQSSMLKHHKNNSSLRACCCPLGQLSLFLVHPPICSKKESHLIICPMTDKLWFFNLWQEHNASEDFRRPRPCVELVCHNQSTSCGSHTLCRKIRINLVGRALLAVASFLNSSWTIWFLNLRKC